MLNFLGLTVLNGAFLFGCFTALIPLIIHLSRSRRTKKMRFSTTRFFTEQFLRSYRMSRLKELLLLACRMLLCFLLAFAFAQPLFMPKGQPFLAGKTRSLVLVIDNSASMGYTEHGRTQLDRARDVARDLLGSLGSEDTVSIVLAGRQAGGPKVLCEKKRHDELGDVLEDVNLLPVSMLGANLTDAVVRAEEIAQSSPAPSKEVYVLSDLQDSGWDLGNEKIAARQGSEVSFFFVSLRPKAVSNLAITAVQYTAARPMAGVPFSIRPLLNSQGEQAQNSQVRLYIYTKDGKAEKVDERPIERRQNGEWSAPRFYHTFTTGGWHAGYVEVQEENLPQDNRRYFALEVLDTVEVLAINGAPSSVPRLDELLFLRAALSFANPEGKSPIQMKVESPATLGTIDLNKYPLIILANVQRLSEDAVTRLENYVDRGGSLWVFLGDKVDAASYNQSLAGTTRPHGGLLPGKLGERKGNADAADKKPEESKLDESYAAIASVSYSHPALAAFQDSKHGNLAGVTFKALWEVKPDPEQAAVLMWAKVLPKAAAERPQADSTPLPRLPLLCEKSFGKGRVLLFASTCNRAWTNFPARPAFLPWTHRLVSYLAQKPAEQQGFFTTGDVVPMPVSVEEGLPPVMVKKPDGTTGYATMTNDPEQQLVFEDTTQAGIYTLYPDRKDRAQLFAVNLDRFESDLTYLDDVLAGREDGETYATPEAKIEAGLKRLLPNRPLVSYVADPGRVNEVSLTAPHGTKLWDGLLWVLLVLVLFEPWLANRISLRFYARPRELPEAPAPRAGRWGRVPSPEIEPRGQEVGSR